MSMISSLIDELNKSADEWNSSNMFELARMCREAADTIWELRDDLQRANSAVQDAEHGESMAWDRVRKAEAENAKLRELACILAWCAVGADCDKCPINTLDFSEWPNGREICYSADDRMRELGVEVDE